MIVTDPHIVGPWVCDKAGGTWTPGRGSAIGCAKNGELVAGVLYEDWNGSNVVCHIRGEPGWASRHFLSVIFDYPFIQLGVQRITAPIDASNRACVRMVKEAMGFELEATLERAARGGGDLLVFRLFKEDCRFIKGKYALSARHS